MRWPRSEAISSPRPSLPVAGTESPPVARITAGAASASPDRRITLQRVGSLSGRTAATGHSKRRRTPRRAASESSASRTSRARFEAGKSLPVSGSRTRRTPSSSSKKRRCSGSGQQARIFLKLWGEEALTKRVGSAREGRMLQRPPPLIRIFFPPSRVLSSSSTRAPARAANKEAIRPAAPAPTTIRPASPGSHSMLRRSPRLPPALDTLSDIKKNASVPRGTPMVITPPLAPRGFLFQPASFFLAALLIASFSCARPDPRLAQADVALKNGDLARALDLSTEVPRETPGSAAALDRKALALQGMGRPGAEETFREAIRLDPSRPEPYDHLATLLYQSGKVDEAIAQWRAAIQADGRYAPARYNLGSVLQARGNLEEAVAQLREAIELAPEMVQARLNLGIALVALGRFPGAEKELKEAVRLAPRDPEAAFNLGAAYVAARRTQEGIRELQRALSLRADFAAARERLATAWFYEGKPAEAEREFKEALRLQPDLAEAHFGLGALYRERGDDASAILEYAATLASRPTHADASTNLSLLYGRRPGPPARAVNRIAAFEIYRRALLRSDYAAAWQTLSERTRRFYLEDPGRFRYAAERGFKDPETRRRLESPAFFLRYLEPPVPNSVSGLPFDPSRMDGIREGPEGDFKVDFRVRSGVPGPDPQR